MISPEDRVIGHDIRIVTVLKSCSYLVGSDLCCPDSAAACSGLLCSLPGSVNEVSPGGETGGILSSCPPWPHFGVTAPFLPL